MLLITVGRVILINLAIQSLIRQAQAKKVVKFDKMAMASRDPRRFDDFPIPPRYA